MSRVAMSLGELLVFSNVAKDEQLQQAVELQQGECKGMLLGDILSSRCGISRDIIEATFMKNILLPMANDVLFQKAETIVRDELHGEHSVTWVMFQPRKCARHCVETQRMLWKEGDFDMQSKSVMDTLEVEGELVVHCPDMEELKVPMRFYYDIRKKRIRAQKKAIEELRKAIFRMRTASA